MLAVCLDLSLPPAHIAASDGLCMVSVCLVTRCQVSASQKAFLGGISTPVIFTGLLPLATQLMNQ